MQTRVESPSADLTKHAYAETTQTAQHDRAPLVDNAYSFKTNRFAQASIEFE